jgi:hypothetical protein
MKKHNIWRVIPLATLVALSTSVVSYGESIKPESVIHVVTIKWTDDASEEKITAALKGVETLAEKYEGITRVWIRSIKAQGPESGVTAAFVMEFKNEKALKDYAGSDAQKEWYEVYIPVRDQSRTFDITN